MADIDLLSPEPIRTGRKLRIHQARIEIQIPLLDQTGEIIGDDLIEVSLGDPGMPRALKSTILDCIMAVARYRGKIA